MLKSEVAKLLVFSASVEGREATDLEVAAWAELLADVDYEVASEIAREHYRNEPRRLWPADVLYAIRARELEEDGQAWEVRR